jgi:hypothetical protein
LPLKPKAIDYTCFPSYDRSHDFIYLLTSSGDVSSNAFNLQHNLDGVHDVLVSEGNLIFKTSNMFHHGHYAVLD